MILAGFNFPNRDQNRKTYFFKVQHHNGDEAVITEQLLKDAGSRISESVLELPSANKEVAKFSVRTDNNDVEFAHLFRSSANSEVYVNCLSGLCQARFAKKRKVLSLNTAGNLCVHLETFKNFLSASPHELCAIYDSPDSIKRVF